MPAGVESMFSAVETPWHKIGKVTFCFILLICIKFPKKKSSSVKTDKQVALLLLYISAILTGS